MKTHPNNIRLLSVFLMLLIFLCTACAQPPHEVDEKQPVNPLPPYNEDGAAYTQSHLLPDGFETDTRLPPRFSVFGDTLILSNITIQNQPMLIKWNLTSNTLYTEIPAAAYSKEDASVFLKVHLPTEDGGAVQLIDAITYMDPQTEDAYPAPGAIYDPIAVAEKLLISVNADGTTRFIQSVDALFDDGYSHVCSLYRDDVTGYLYLSELGSETLILDRDGVLLDRIPWSGGSRSEFVPGADGALYFVERDEISAEWQYFSYDPNIHALVKTAAPIWNGYRIFPHIPNSWYACTPEGFAYRTSAPDGTVGESLLVSWVNSGFTDAAIRNTYPVHDADGNLILFAITRDYKTDQASLTVFQPHMPYTAPERSVLQLYADTEIHTLQEAVVAFNTSSQLYRVIYTDDASSADLLFIGPFSPNPPEIPLLDLYPFMKNDPMMHPDQFLPGVLDAMEDDTGALNTLCIRAALDAKNNALRDKFTHITSPADWLCAVLSADAMPEDFDIIPVLGLAIPQNAADPIGAWKFLCYFAQSESTETLNSGADQGFSAWSNLFSKQLDQFDGVYGVMHGNGNQFAFAYPTSKEEDFDPMTNINFAAAAKEGARSICFDRDLRAALEAYFTSPAS